MTPASMTSAPWSKMSLSNRNWVQSSLFTASLSARTFGLRQRSSLHWTGMLSTWSISRALATQRQVASPTSLSRRCIIRSPLFSYKCQMICLASWLVTQWEVRSSTLSCSWTPKSLPNFLVWFIQHPSLACFQRWTPARSSLPTLCPVWWII